MTDATISPALPAAAHADNYLTHRRGIASWLVTLDHKRIGVLYLVSVLAAFLLGGIFALLVRTQLLRPEGLLFHAAQGGTDLSVYKPYNQMFTVHGTVMIFLVLIPGIPGALGNFVLPIMIGARDVAFPRLNLMSYYLYLIGAGLALASVFIGAVDTGWTFYPPYSTGTPTAVICLVFGAFVLGFSSIFTGLNFIVTIHKLRCRGMTWFRMPLLLWGLYATAVIQICATPVLGITLLLLILERLFNLGIFNPAYGGDPILFQHFFWFYSHPAVYLMILPAMGVMSEVVSTFSRRAVFGYKFVAMSSLAIALIGFLVWGHHMFPNGQSAPVNTIFSGLTMLVAIPTAVKIWNWLATMYKGSIVLMTPMCYALCFFFLFAIGGLTGLFLATLATDFHVHDTYFLVAHFHYTMVGGAMFMFLAGLHYWWPKFTGRMYNESAGRLACLLLLVAFNLTFFPQFVMGTHGMPRRVAIYQPEFQNLHVISTVGAYAQFAAVTLIAGYLMVSLFRGRPAPANPWGGSTLEWTCPSPPPHDNFPTPPSVDSIYDYSQLVWNEALGGYERSGGRKAGVEGIRG
ncbi:MAG: cbb3-type cytochrome c oxidase subunit I [Thermoguttaceae bacterium]|jgi:cytochrome c oxidase subunit 1